MQLDDIIKDQTKRYFPPPSEINKIRYKRRRKQNLSHEVFYCKLLSMSSVSNDLYKNSKLHLSDGWSACGYHYIESSTCSSVLPLIFYSRQLLYLPLRLSYFLNSGKKLWSIFYCTFVKQYLVFWPLRGSFLMKVKVVTWRYLACLFIESMSLICSTVGQ